MLAKRHFTPLLTPGGYTFSANASGGDLVCNSNCSLARVHGVGRHGPDGCGRVPARSPADGLYVSFTNDPVQSIWREVKVLIKREAALAAKRGRTKPPKDIIDIYIYITLYTYM